MMGENKTLDRQAPLPDGPGRGPSRSPLLDTLTLAVPTPAAAGRRRGSRPPRRGDKPEAAGRISIQGSECANAGQTPILLTHKTPGLAASPGSRPSPSQAAPFS